MSENESRPFGRYFEEMEIGTQVITAGRTITETDIVTFAGLSGDYNQIHTDAHYAATHDFGQRVAHGLLVQSISSGLAVQTRFMERTVLAFREIETKFTQAVFIGDTIHVEIEVKEKKALPRLGGGSVIMKVSTKNQNGKVVQRGVWTMLIQSKPE